MPIVPATDIDLRFSSPAAPGGNILPGQDVLSLGGWLSTTSCRMLAVNGLFGPLSGDDNTNQTVTYRCIFLVNLSSRYAWSAVTVWLPVQGVGAVLALGVDPTVATPLGTVLPQARVTGDGHTPPIGVSFTSPLTPAAGIVLGTLPPLNCKAFWLRRTGPATPGPAPDGGTLRFAGTSLG